MTHRAPTERSFGVSFAVVGAAAAVFSWWRAHDSLALGFLVAAVILLAFGLYAPRALRIPNLLWWRVAQVLARINARVVLTVLFIVVITPVGILRRLLGGNPLMPRERGWSPYPAGRRNPKHYEHLY